MLFKSCAAKKREMNKPGYDPETVKHNNLKRAGLLDSENYTPENYAYSGWADNDQWGDCDFGIHE